MPLPSPKPDHTNARDFLARPFKAPPASFIQHLEEVTNALSSTGKVSATGVDAQLLIAYLELQNDRGSWYSIDCPPERREQNRSIVLPSIVDAVQGNEEARRFYETERMFHYDCLPPWAEPPIRETVTSRINWYRPGTVLSQSDRWIRSHITKMKFPVDTIPATAALGLRFVCSYRVIEDLVKDLGRRSYNESERWQVLVKGGARYFIARDLYSPVATGPVGKHALETLKVVANLMHRALIIEDLVQAVGVQIPNETKLELLSGLRGTWDLQAHPFFTNLLQYVALPPTIRESISESQLARQLLRPGGIKVEAPCETPPRAIEEPTVTPSERTALLHREQFIRGITAIVQRECPTIDDPREIARRFFSLHRRGACSYPRVAFELSAGVDPYTLLGAIYTKELRREKQHSGRKRPQSVQNAFELTDEPLCRTVAVHSTRTFEQWLTSLDDETQARLRGRLVRVELGNLGDWNAISTRVQELRCDIGPGYRLYFSRRSPSEILMLCGGAKDSQFRDIRRAERIAAVLRL